MLFNRDVKPGGLAEYGIFPTKHIMKEGLRKQFRGVLDNPNIDFTAMSPSETRAI